MLGMIQSKAASGDSEAIKTLNILREIGFSVPKEDEYPQSWKRHGDRLYKLWVEMRKRGDLPDCPEANESPASYFLSVSCGKYQNHRYHKSTGR